MVVVLDACDACDACDAWWLSSFTSSTDILTNLFSMLISRYDKTGSGNIDYQEFVSRVKYTHADLDVIAAKLR